jgi:hypothetical protein
MLNSCRGTRHRSFGTKKIFFMPNGPGVTFPVTVFVVTSAWPGVSAGSDPA